VYVVSNHFAMPSEARMRPVLKAPRGQAMRFAALCIVASAVCGRGEAKRGPGHDAAVAAGLTRSEGYPTPMRRTLLEEQRACNPRRRKSSRSARLVLSASRLTKMLLLGSSVHFALMYGKAYEPTKAAIEADLLGWGKTHRNWGKKMKVSHRKHVDRLFTHKHKVDHASLQYAEDFLEWALVQKWKYWDPEDTQDPFAGHFYTVPGKHTTPDWLVRAIFKPWVIQFMAKHVMKDDPLFKMSVRVLTDARVLDRKISEAVQYINEFFKANPDKADMEFRLHLRKKSEIMTVL